jgi:hypothetical protein
MDLVFLGQAVRQQCVGQVPGSRYSFLGILACATNEGRFETSQGERDRYPRPHHAGSNHGDPLNIHPYLLLLCPCSMLYLQQAQHKVFYDIT